jgi:hypothetical protein
METCIITQKLIAHCRRQLCLTHKQIGPARVSCCSDSANGDIVRPSQTATSVTADNLRIKRIYMQKKSPNPFKAGFWDITVGLTFEYLLTFWDMCGCEINSVEAGNAYSMKLTMNGTDTSCDYEDGMLFASDMPLWNGAAIDSPICRVAAHIGLLDVKLYRNKKKNCMDEVRVTVGFLAAASLLRYACLNLPNAQYAGAPTLCSFDSGFNCNNLSA